ncbi:MAG: RIP metalloprotease [Bifidobacteriaceae bacterium]|nr:RIP metalloprotease [Bifidobacteriaceae bacterium]
MGIDVSAIAGTALGVFVFIVVLVISVAWHELGHLVPAKLFKVPVSQYMVGFWRTIWSKRVGETEYGVKWLLLGGYIRMIGMYAPERSPRAAKTGWRANLADSAREATREELTQYAAAAPAAGAAGGNAPTASGKSVADRAYYKLTAPRKVIIMLGGPTMNLVLALVFLVLAQSVVGVYGYSTAISGVTPCVTAEGVVDADCGPDSRETPAQAAGLKAGDRIVAWDGHRVSTWDQFLTEISGAKAAPTKLTVERAGKRLDFEVTPMEVAAGTPAARVIIGVSAGEWELTKQPVTDAPGSLGRQIAASAKLYASLPVAVWDTLVDMVEGNERRPDSPVSIVGIARISGEVATVDVADIDVDQNRLRWGAWLQLAAAVNLALWMFNLLPLVPLDGGHIANALYEGGRRTFARWRGQRPLPGPADSARLMPLTYLVVGLLILMTIILVTNDLLFWYD